MRSVAGPDIDAGPGLQGPGRRQGINPPTAWRHFGITDGSPPGDPGGGITGVAAPFWGGSTVIRGSTFGGVMTPFRWDKSSLKVPVPSAGAIRSGGTGGALGGATGTVGFAGDVGDGACASAGPTARVNANSQAIRIMT
jgi:hypothetical protein